MNTSPRPRRPPTQRAGFTLIELLVALSVLAVLAALAAPSFADLTRRMRVDTVREQFIGSMNLARTEAIRHGRTVVMRRIEPCAAANAATQWYCGWQVFVDLDQNNAMDAGEPLLREVRGDSSVLIQRTSPVGGAYVQFTRFGMPEQSGLSFQIFPAGQKAEDPTNAQRVCLSGAGRMRTVKDTVACT
ncbi:MAG: GspH/FimT family protein [Hydrogenophaga sp.]|jgi:type IV fimbrial biogenesis protein FimT|uniref:GspH/FimT family pseudopilin n=1 Tax=Hydrogenophaga sp. TaxID=1904254 RepID=UPI00262F646C|nr:GspH/FimT family protein [Hydrogenophaga sp.]MCV0438662.1 GspH/FimT family protein [Hydrogenophaga sp.]